MNQRQTVYLIGVLSVAAICGAWIIVRDPFPPLAGDSHEGQSHITVSSPARIHGEVSSEESSKIALEAAESSAKMLQSNANNSSELISNDRNLWRATGTATETSNLPFPHAYLRPEDVTTLDLDRERLRSLRMGDRFALPVPYGEGQFAALVHSVEQTDADIRSIVIRFDGHDPAIGMLITIGQKAFFGTVTTPKDEYVVEGDESRAVIFPGRLIAVPTD